MTMQMSKLNVDRDNRRFSKLITKNHSIDEIDNIYSELWQTLIPAMRNANLEQGRNLNAAQGFAIADCLSIRALALKKYHSFYVFDKSVVDFIKNTDLKDKEISQMHSVAHDIVKEYENHGFVVHMAGEDQSILYTFGPHGVIYKDETMSPGETREGLSVFHKRYCRNELADIGFTVITPEDGIVGGKIVNSEEGSEEWRIFFNLCLYMSAFPEYVLDGAPPIKVHGSRENSTTIRASRQMKEVYRDGVSPHMRRGHFRFLKSERYNKKRFQAIYVKPTMVGGHANTVVGEHGETPHV